MISLLEMLLITVVAETSGYSVSVNTGVQGRSSVTIPHPSLSTGDTCGTLITLVTWVSGLHPHQHLVSLDQHK